GRTARSRRLPRLGLSTYVPPQRSRGIRSGIGRSEALSAARGRGQPEHPALSAAALAAVLEDPERAVRSLLDRADPHAHREALRLARRLAVELDPHDRLRREPADERIALPLRELAAAVEHQARRGDHRVPERRRRRELRPRVVIRNVPAVVVVAVRDDRITVVRAAADEIELVAAGRPHLDVPEPSVGIEREPERVAVAERPDL